MRVSTPKERGAKSPNKSRTTGATEHAAETAVQIHVLRPGRTRGLLTRLNHGDQWLDVRHELNCRNLSWVYTGKSRHDDHVTHLQIINRNDWQPLEHVSHVRSLCSRSLSARALRSGTLCSSSLRA